MLGGGCLLGGLHFMVARGPVDVSLKQQAASTVGEPTAGTWSCTVPSGEVL